MERFVNKCTEMRAPGPVGKVEADASASSADASQEVDPAAEEKSEEIDPAAEIAALKLALAKAEARAAEVRNSADANYRTDRILWNLSQVSEGPKETSSGASGAKSVDWNSSGKLEEQNQKLQEILELQNSQLQLMGGKVEALESLIRSTISTGGGVIRVVESRVVEAESPSPPPPPTSAGSTTPRPRIKRSQSVSAAPGGGPAFLSEMRSKAARRKSVALVQRRDDVLTLLQSVANESLGTLEDTQVSRILIFQGVSILDV